MERSGSAIGTRLEALYLQSIGADVVLYEPDAVCRRLAERQSPDLRTASTSRGVLSLSEDRNACTVQDAYRADEVMTGASQHARSERLTVWR